MKTNKSNNNNNNNKNNNNKNNRGIKVEKHNINYKRKSKHYTKHETKMKKLQQLEGKENKNENETKINNNKINMTPIQLYATNYSTNKPQITYNKRGNRKQVITNNYIALYNDKNVNSFQFQKQDDKNNLVRVRVTITLQFVQKLNELVDITVQVNEQQQTKTIAFLETVNFKTSNSFNLTLSANSKTLTVVKVHIIEEYKIIEGRHKHLVFELTDESISHSSQQSSQTINNRKEDDPDYNSNFTDTEQEEEEEEEEEVKNENDEDLNANVSNANLVSRSRICKNENEINNEQKGESGEPEDTLNAVYKLKIDPIKYQDITEQLQQHQKELKWQKQNTILQVQNEVPILTIYKNIQPQQLLATKGSIWYMQLLAEQIMIPKQYIIVPEQNIPNTIATKQQSKTHVTVQ